MTTPLMTAEELLQTNIPDKCIELVRGRLIVREPPGGRHGAVAARLCREIGNHVHAQQLGTVYLETGFTLARNPDTVRGPDVAFVRKDRAENPVPVGFPEFTPDLVVEVLSPGDRPGETLAKIGDWLDAGARLVWVIDPERRIARVYRHDGSESTVNDEGQLNGEDVLPGFTCGLAGIF